MKQGIHPDYHEITVRLTDGSEFKTSSTWGKKGDVLQLDIDTLTHNAWVGGKTKVNERAGNIAKFKQKFGAMNLASMSGQIGTVDASAATAPKKKDAKPAKKAETKEEAKAE